MNDLKQIDLTKIHKRLSRVLDDERYMHTLGVEFTAASLAMRYGGNVKMARLAGLLHDCAKGKNIDASEYIDLARKYNINVNDAEMKNPALLHAKLGGFFAMKKYHVTDPEIIEAIICHTTGKPDMTLLEKIIYVADYIEPTRSMMDGLEEARKVAFEDLDKALLIILEGTVKHIKKKKYVIDPMTEKTYNYYKGNN